VEDFKGKCVRWEKYDKELSALDVVQTRKSVTHLSNHSHSTALLTLDSYDLPSDVFTEGEVKPIRLQKKKTTNGTSKKRGATDVCPS
jgi:poly(A) polymerase